MNDKTKEIPDIYYILPWWREGYEKSEFVDTHTFEEYVNLQRNLAVIERYQRKRSATSELVH